MIRLADAGRHVRRGDGHFGAVTHGGEVPGHLHGARERRVFGLEDGQLHDAFRGHQIGESDLDDVRRVRRFAGRGGRVEVGQRHPEAAAGPRIPVLDPAAHAFGWQPGFERFPVEEGFVDGRGRCGDHPAATVDPVHGPDSRGG
ncbi:hypothetical protein C791_1339 [Amycolatopsis azurea DSM 43854]|uniref:Uncharacterized protein n=1 Tax=Amycolatopsis azurea DSM 43854 TaxID=1238180 RepID=M2QQM6_9PSEU|nr:hypothetical protein C791_1339 [Amycolatopsis azurea DSM 43854]